MSEQRHIIIAGMPRAATTWVTDMFKINAAEKGMNVSHDGWMNAPITRKLRNWKRRPGTHINVSADNYTLATTIVKHFPDAQWCCLWRDPRAVFLSLVGMHHIPIEKTGLMLHMESREFGAIAANLQFLQQSGVELSHWHFDYYTTAEGFKTLAAHLGVPLREELKMSTEFNKRDYKVFMEDLPSVMPGLIDDLFYSHPHVKAAYEAARRS